MQQTIVAIATPPGRGSVGVVRVSGPAVEGLLGPLLGQRPAPRSAVFTAFRDAEQQPIDRGIAVFFEGPASYTGEDCLELQAHGNPLLLDRLILRLTELGCRPARPGEFTERAFLNGKLDLAQAEAVADLITAETEAGIKAAQRSLTGEFSRQVDALVEECIALRCYVEAAIDFSEEEIDLLAQGDIAARIDQLARRLHGLLGRSRSGAVLREGRTWVLCGEPNAGKSSLMNVLSGLDTAIVTDIPGTTRDLLKVSIQIEGTPIHLIDTAGLRAQPADAIEAEGIRRARAALASADGVLLVTDDRTPEAAEALHSSLPGDIPILLIRNKIDLSGAAPLLEPSARGLSVRLSLKTLAGLDKLHEGFSRLLAQSSPEEAPFMARRRHLDALGLAEASIAEARTILTEGRPELLAEQLRIAQDAFSKITGVFSSDDLLGEIFSSFCIGK